MDHVVGTLPSPPAVKTVAPFMSQIDVFPLVSRQTMSLMPSALKSPVPTTLQEVGMLPTPADDRTWVPFMNQIEVLPLESRHRISAFPSPLKSAVPAMLQVIGTLPKLAVCEIASSFVMSQIATLPLLSRQRM